MDGALINGNLFDILVAPSCFTIQPVRSEIAMSALHPKADIPQSHRQSHSITSSARAIGWEGLKVAETLSRR
jgi:hypothetical protein